MGTQGYSYYFGLIEFELVEILFSEGGKKIFFIRVLCLETLVILVWVNPADEISVRWREERRFPSSVLGRVG